MPKIEERPLSETQLSEKSEKEEVERDEWILKLWEEDL